MATEGASIGPFNIQANQRDLANRRIWTIVGTNPPVNGDTGAGYVGIGGTYIDDATGDMYINTNTVANPIWNLSFSANGIGYASGQGGTVTQLTSKSTAVTLNEPSGLITMNNAALAAGAIVSFQLNNFFVKANYVLILNHISGGTSGAYTLNARAANNNAQIDVRNATAGSLSEAIVISFAVVRVAIT